MLSWPNKDPNEVLDYELSWARRLADGDTIAGSTWLVDVGDVTVDSDTFTDTKATVWLSGGTVGTRCTLTNRVTTAGGRTMDQSVGIRIREK